MIQTIEETAFRAVPTAICLHFDGWRLRFNHAVTRRANSVWPNADFGRHSLAEKLDAVETFYRNHGATPRFQITSAALPVGLDDFLANCGYAKSQINDVQIADTSQVKPATSPRRPCPSPSPRRGPPLGWTPIAPSSMWPPTAVPSTTPCGGGCGRPKRLGWFAWMVNRPPWVSPWRTEAGPGCSTSPPTRTFDGGARR